MTEYSPWHEASGPPTDTAYPQVTPVSGKAFQAIGSAAVDGATNLLVKAGMALDDGADDRAHAFVRRAVAIPFDTYEQAFPAEVAAHMMLFNAVSDTLEELEDGDDRWLTAALIVLERADVGAVGDLLGVLGAIAQDHAIARADRRRIATARARIATRDGAGSDTAPTVHDAAEPAKAEHDLAAHVMALLQAMRHYDDELTRLGV